MVKMIKFATLALLLQMNLITALDLIVEVVSTDLTRLLQLQLFKHFAYYF